MPQSRTFLQLQDRVLRRAGRDLVNDTVGRALAKDLLQDTYEDIVSRALWKFLFDTEALVFGAGVSTKTLQKYFHGNPDNVWTLSGDRVVPLNPMTRVAFNRFVRDGSTQQTDNPRKYFIVGSESTVGAPDVFGHLKLRIWPPPSASITVNIDGYVHPSALVADTDRPRLPPILLFALVRGTLASMFEVDEDDRADSMFVKYESDIEKALQLETLEPDQYEKVGVQLDNEMEDHFLQQDVRYPWER